MAVREWCFDEMQTPETASRRANDFQYRLRTTVLWCWSDLNFLMIKTSPRYFEYLYAIDPGAAACFLAVFYTARLTDLRSLLDLPQGLIVSPGRIVLEVPQIDKDARKSNDLINVNGAGHWLAGQIHGASGGRCELVTRAARGRKDEAGWKGQVAKPIHHSWALKALNQAELAIVEAVWVTLRGRKFAGLSIGQYVDQACHHLATTGKEVYNNAIHNYLDAVALGLTQLGRV